MDPCAPSDLVRAIAPTGTLRVAINYGNVVLAQTGPNGAPAGVTADLARELGRRLAVPVRFTTYDTAGKVVEALGGDRPWDMAFLAIDPLRAETIAFSPPYVIIEGAYMVPATSTIACNDDVDRAGIRIAVGRDTAYDLHLGRHLKAAERVFAPTSAAALERFERGDVDAVASVRQPLEARARGRTDVRVLPGSFMAIRQAIAIPRGRPLADGYIHAFIEALKQDGFVARSLERSGQHEAVVAAGHRS